MLTTKERIETDIKENVLPLIETFIKTDVGLLTEETITECTATLSGKLQNLSTAGTRAGEMELSIALQVIERRVAKKIVEHLKERYKL